MARIDDMKLTDPEVHENPYEFYALMRSECPPAINVKASGGIRTLEDVLLFRSLGCNRIGASATASILEELQRGH